MSRSTAGSGPGPRNAVRSPTEPWTVLRLVVESAGYLRGRGVEGARLDAEHLVAHALGLERLDLYLQHDRPLTPEELDTVRPLVRRRGGREPLQYILGRQPFRDLDLIVDPRVLIPRPETEVLVEHALIGARERAGDGDDLVALDIGTGSGAIALALASEGPFARVVGVDTSPEALEVAALNLERSGIGDRVTFRCGRDFDALGSEERFNLIVSNPPYVAESERAGLQPEVVDWEPEDALFAGADGLDTLRRLAAGAASRLEDGGLVIVEVGDGQADAVARMFREQPAMEGVKVERDLAGKDRFVMATRRREPFTDRELKT